MRDLYLSEIFILILPFNYEENKNNRSPVKYNQRIREY